MPDKDKMHVTKRPDGDWQAKREGAERPSVVAPTQGEAEAGAKKILGNSPQGGEVTIHKPNGKIRDSDTVAPKRDPNPPKDKRH